MSLVRLPSKDDGGNDMLAVTSAAALATSPSPARRASTAASINNGSARRERRGSRRSLAEEETTTAPASAERRRRGGGRKQSNTTTTDAKNVAGALIAKGGKKRGGTKSNQQDDADQEQAAKDWDDDLINQGRDYHPHMSGKSFRLYRNLLTNAGMGDRAIHLYHIKNFKASKSMYMEGSCLKLYKDLVEARQYDEFCRPIPKGKGDDDGRNGKAEKLTLTFIADENDEEAQRLLDKKRLVTPAWKIGYKPALHHPVGK